VVKHYYVALRTQTVVFTAITEAMVTRQYHEIGPTCAPYETFAHPPSLLGIPALGYLSRGINLGTNEGY
jgi:hypothetical protein